MNTGLPRSTVEADDIQTLNSDAARMIDTWFPCLEVDRAVRTAGGSGRSEKSLMTWFASRPTAQARAAVLCSLLPDTEENRADVKAAVEFNQADAVTRLRARIVDQFSRRSPVVLDVFSGRGIIPLEAARLGATAIGTDLSPVATLAGRLLADYPMQNWSAEPPVPFATAQLIADDEAESDGGESSDTTLFGDESTRIHARAIAAIPTKRSFTNRFLERLNRQADVLTLLFFGQLIMLDPTPAMTTDVIAHLSDFFGSERVTL